MRIDFMEIVACLLTTVAIGRHSPGTNRDDNPLIVIYVENQGSWIREFGASTIDHNILSRNMPVRNFVLNYARFGFNPEECSVVSINSADIHEGDPSCTSKNHTGCASWPGDDLQPSNQKGRPGGMLTSIMQLKTKYPYIKIMASIGGWTRSSTYHDCIETKSEVMINSIVDFVNVFGFDGIDLDWQFPNCDKKPCGCQRDECTDRNHLANIAGPKDWDMLKIFTERLSKRFNTLEDELRRRLYLTITLGVDQKLIEGNNEIWSRGAPISWLCKEDFVDWINVMTHDLYGQDDEVSGPLSPLYPSCEGPVKQYSVDDAVQRITKRCAKPWKLVLGLSTYGKAYQDVEKGSGKVPGLWQKLKGNPIYAGGTWEMGKVSFWDIDNIILRDPNCEKHWDPVSLTPTIYCTSMPRNPEVEKRLNGTNAIQRGQKNTFITYENGKSWNAKMKYARENQIAGAAIWTASHFGNLAYSHDATRELFNGLLSGWTGKNVDVGPPVRNSFKYSQGEKWDTYPCPLIANAYFTNGKVPVDRRRCVGAKFDKKPNGYYKWPINNLGTINTGENNILIHKSDGTTPTPRPKTDNCVNTTKATKTTTKAINPIVSECKLKIDAQQPAWSRQCQFYCEYYSPDGPWNIWCKTAVDGKSLAKCIIRMHSFCTLVDDQVLRD